MDQRVSHLVSVVDTYRKENADLASKLTAISQQVDAQSSLRGQVAGQHEQQGRLTNALISRVSQLERRLAEALTGREEAEQAVAALEQENQVLREERTAREREGQERLQTVRELTEALSAMVARVQAEFVPRAEYECSRAAQSRAEEEAEAQEQDATTQREELQRLQVQYDELHLQHDKLRTQHEELQQDTTRVYETLRDDLVPRGELEELQSRHRALQEQLRDDTVSVQSFTDVVQRYDELESALQSEYIALGQYRLMESRAVEAEARAASLDITVEEAQQAHAEVSRQLADCEERLDRCLAEMKGLIARLDELENSYNVLHGERNHYREVYEKGCDHIASLQKEKSALLIQLGNSKAAISRASSQRTSPDREQCTHSPPCSTGRLSCTNSSPHNGPDGSTEELARLRRESSAWRRKYERSRRKTADWRTVAQGLVSQRMQESIGSAGDTSVTEGRNHTASFLNSLDSAPAEGLSSGERRMRFESPGFVAHGSSDQ